MVWYIDMSDSPNPPHTKIYTYKYYTIYPIYISLPWVAVCIGTMYIVYRYVNGI